MKIENWWKFENAQVIAHRLSTVRTADKVVVIDGGKIAEAGTHDELIAKAGVYQKLVARQLLGARATLADEQPVV